jgi:hypothetical protein
MHCGSTIYKRVLAICQDPFVASEQVFVLSRPGETDSWSWLELISWTLFSTLIYSLWFFLRVCQFIWNLCYCGIYGCSYVAMCLCWCRHNCASSRQVTGFYWNIAISLFLSVSFDEINSPGNSFHFANHASCRVCHYIGQGTAAGDRPYISVV